MPEINIVIFDIPDYKYQGMQYTGTPETCAALLEAIRALINGWDANE
jgi:hypothetical protein